MIQKAYLGIECVWWADFARLNPMISSSLNYTFLLFRQLSDMHHQTSELIESDNAVLFCRIFTTFYLLCYSQRNQIWPENFVNNVHDLLNVDTSGVHISKRS